MKEIKPGKLSLPFGISPGRQGLRPHSQDNAFYLLSPADGGLLKNRVRALPACVRPLASRAKKIFLLPLAACRLHTRGKYAQLNEGD